VAEKKISRVTRASVKTFTTVTHLRLAAVRVEDLYVVIRTIDPRHDEDDAVGANAEVSVAQLHGLLRRHLGHPRVPVVHLRIETGISKQNRSIVNSRANKTEESHQDEVVAEALVLDEVESALGLTALDKRGGGGGAGPGGGHLVVESALGLAALEERGGDAGPGGGHGHRGDDAAWGSGDPA